MIRTFDAANLAPLGIHFRIPPGRGRSNRAVDESCGVAVTPALRSSDVAFDFDAESDPDIDGCDAEEAVVLALRPSESHGVVKLSATETLPEASDPMLG